MNTINDHQTQLQCVLGQMSQNSLYYDLRLAFLLRII